MMEIHEHWQSKKAIIVRILLWILGIAAVLGVAGYVAFQVSPWPSVLLIRRGFEKEAARVSQALEKHIPSNVSARLNERYDATDGDAYLDVFYPSEIVLAGDSGGAHIAAQVANIISVPSYASAVGIAPSIERSQLHGLILHCGAYDTKRINLDGPFGGFLKTVLWSYSGGKDFATNPQFATASVINYVTADFPPMFISAGNADLLLPQSRAFAETAAGLGVHVDSLFFPPDYTPALPHEYQFNLDVNAGQLALERSVKFLSIR